jgi:hypothetical protein
MHDGPAGRSDSDLGDARIVMRSRLDWIGLSQPRRSSMPFVDLHRLDTDDQPERGWMVLLQITRVDEAPWSTHSDVPWVDSVVKRAFTQID